MEIKTTQKPLLQRLFKTKYSKKTPPDGGQQKSHSRTSLLCNTNQRNCERYQTKTAQSCSWHTLLHFTIKIPQTHGTETTENDYSKRLLTKIGPYAINSKSSPNGHTKYEYIIPQNKRTDSTHQQCTQRRL